MSLFEKTGLYIHIPFCISKCNYCDFNSYAGRLSSAEDYFNAMKKEIELYREQLNHNLIETVFIGGGTPSVVDPKYISEILSACFKTFNISEKCEISIESNPGTLDELRLMQYRLNGIDRLSVGLQAYQDNLLKYLGRCHSTEDFKSSVEMARKAGFSNINADVIFGIPGQTTEDWKSTLKALVELQVTHISAYSLKIEEGTKFGDWLQSGKLIPIQDELDRDMYHYAIDYLREHGYNQYEISNFAKEGYECKHNIIYWKCEEYLGIGAGAHSYLDNVRFSNEYSIEGYIKSLARGEKPVEERTTIDFCDRMSEFMFLGLRLTKGVSNKEFQAVFNQNMFEKYSDKIEKLKQKKLIDVDGDYIRLTRLGLDLANQVFVEFV